MALLAKEFQGLKTLASSSSRFILDLPKAMKAKIEEWISRPVFPVSLNLLLGPGRGQRKGITESPKKGTEVVCGIQSQHSYSFVLFFKISTLESKALKNLPG